MTIEEQVCEYNKMMTEIAKLKEASQYFTCRGHIEVYTKLDEAIGEAEAVAFAKQYWMVREEPKLEQVGDRIYFFQSLYNNKVTR